MKAQPKIILFHETIVSKRAQIKHLDKQQSNTLLWLVANKPLYPTTQKSLTNRG